MYDPVFAVLRYGVLGNGDGIPCAYALETHDGRSIIFQNSNDFTSLAYYLGAPIDPNLAWNDGGSVEYEKAIDWLDDQLLNVFDIADSYAEYLDDAV